jgi:predicted thioredoxin/glutaredoxin
MPAGRLTLVHRRDCPLCDEMLAELRALGRSLPLPPLETLDVDADPQLRRRYGLDVPVLLLDGSVVCRHRLDYGELRRLLNGPASSGAPPQQRVR